MFISYIREKLHILSHFGVKLTEEQAQPLYSLKSEIAIDNYVRGIILNSLED